MIQNDKNFHLENLIVLTKDKYFYLIARDNNNGKTYAIELKRKRNNLFLNRSSLIQSCECKETDENAFLIDENGEIQGCTSGNHTITKID